MLYKFTKLAMLIAATILLSFVFFVSCKKMPHADTTPDPVPIDTTKKDSTTPIPPELSAKVISSISGFVISGGRGVDEAIEGVNVTFGNKTATTDEYGYFEIKNATVTKLAAQVTAAKPGFFTGYKTIITEEGESNFEKLQLRYLPGGTWSASSGLFLDGTYYTISIPPNAFVIAGTSTHFSGNYFFYSDYMLKNDDPISVNMPGDSRGIDTAGKLKLLTTNGLVWCYAEGINGEKLQLSSPGTITLRSNITATVPSWRYDVATGLWRQGAAANPDGYGLTCTINKLGIWNFATPVDYTVVSAKLVTTAGDPLPYTYVKIGGQADPNASPIYKFTDANGYIKIASRVNTSLSFDVHAPFGYSDPVFSKSFDNIQADLSLGNIPMNTIDVFTIDGSITSCSGTPVSDGFLMMNGLRFLPGSNGRFHFSTVIKNLGIYTNPGFVFAEENSTKQKSDRIVPTLVPGDNDLGNIKVCGTTEVVRTTSKLVDNAGNPLANLYVKTVPASIPVLESFSISDAQGNVVSYTYENTPYLLTVYGSQNCQTAVFSTSFNTTNRDTSIGTLIVSGLITANVTGSVVDCNNNPVTSGQIIVQKDQKNLHYAINSNGTFNFTIAVCNAADPEPVTLIAENNISLQTGSPVNISLHAGFNNVGTLSACFNNSSSLEFMNYSIDTAHYSLVSPFDSFNQSVDPATHWNLIGGINTNYDGVYFALTGTIAVGSPDVSIDEFDISQQGTSYGRYVTPTSPQPIVNITEYGAVGEYIAGNITVQVVDLSDNSVHDATCSFRVKRKE